MMSLRRKNAEPAGTFSAGSLTPGFRRLPTAAGALCLLFVSVLMGVFAVNAEAARPFQRRGEDAPVREEAARPLEASDFHYSGVLIPEPPGQSVSAGTLMEEGVLYMAELPVEVFSAAGRADGADICVFNAEGKRVPFAMAAQGWQENVTTHFLDSLYPLWGRPHTAALHDFTLSFSLDREGRLTPRVTGGKDLTQAPEGQELKGYVIPLAEPGIPVSSMHFSWDKGQENTVQFTLETSDDLKQWQTLLSRAALVRFDGPDGPLESSVLSLDGVRLGRYLRILFDSGLAPKAIRSVTLEQWSAVKKHKTLKLKPPVVIQAAREGRRQRPSPAALVYSLVPEGGMVSAEFEADSLRLAAPNPGEYAAVRVYTRQGETLPWSLRGEYTFFAIMRGGTILESGPMPLGGKSVGQIRLEALSPDKTVPDDLALSITYTPVNLYFLAKGPGPYTVHWGGKYAARRDDAGIFSLMTQGADVRPAMLSPDPVAAGPPPAPDGTNQAWLRYGLWGLLGIGVFLLLAMLLKLMRSMRRP